MSFVVKRNAFGDKRTMNNSPRTRPSTLRFEQRVDLRSANRKRKTFIAEKHHRESSNSYKEGTVQIGHQSSNIETKFQNPGQVPTSRPSSSLKMSSLRIFLTEPL